MLEPTMENRTYRSAETDHQNNLGGEVRTDWVLDEVRSLFDLPFNDLLFKAQNIHRVWFNPNKVQMSTLLSIKTGGCPEDCGYCSQSVKFDTGLDASALMKVEEVLKAARQAKDGGATRFLYGCSMEKSQGSRYGCHLRNDCGDQILGNGVMRDTRHAHSSTSG